MRIKVKASREKKAEKQNVCIVKLKEMDMLIPESSHQGQ
jgi:hypothetical protein